MEQCIICFEDYTPNNMYIILSCNHKLCLICYEKILNTKNSIACPLCRNIIEEQIILNIPPIRIRTISEQNSNVRKYILIAFGIIIILLLIILVILKII